MTYKSKADLREHIEELKKRVSYHSERADSWSTKYWEQDADHDEALDNLKDAHKAEIERIRDSADRIVTRQQDEHRILVEAIKSFYGVTADEVIAALATQRELDDQKLLKDNLKKVKNANKTEEGK